MWQNIHPISFQSISGKVISRKDMWNISASYLKHCTWFIRLIISSLWAEEPTESLTNNRPSPNPGQKKTPPKKTGLHAKFPRQSACFRPSGFTAGFSHTQSRESSIREMLAHAVLHLTSLPELQRLGKSTGVNLSVKKIIKKKKEKKDNVSTPLPFCTRMLPHRRQMAVKPGEASEHTDAPLNKHSAANSEIPPLGTLSLRSRGRAAADCENMCSKGRAGRSGERGPVVHMPWGAWRVSTGRCDCRPPRSHTRWPAGGPCWAPVWAPGQQINFVSSHRARGQKKKTLVFNVIYWPTYGDVCRHTENSPSKGPHITPPSQISVFHS